MKPFRYERASDASTAVAMLAQAPTGAFLGGGTNLVDRVLKSVGRGARDFLWAIDTIQRLTHDPLLCGAYHRLSSCVSSSSVRTRVLRASETLNALSRRG